MELRDYPWLSIVPGAELRRIAMPDLLGMCGSSARRRHPHPLVHVPLLCHAFFRDLQQELLAFLNAHREDLEKIVAAR